MSQRVLTDAPRRVQYLGMASAATPRDTWRAILDQQGRSIAWLADRTTTPRQTVYAYSMGKRRPTDAWLARVAEVLGVPVELLTDDPGKAA
jgi:hypothetical protein